MLSLETMKKEGEQDVVLEEKTVGLLPRFLPSFSMPRASYKFQQL